MIYDYVIKDTEGKHVSMSDFKGKVLLIVNIASKCGFTPQLEDLQKIYDKYKLQGLEVVGFPCNQFLNQAPGTNSELNNFCKLNYGVTFQLSEKIDVRGKDAHPLYSHLTSQSPFNGFDMNNINDKMLYSVIEQESPENLVGDSVKWNFTKFLVDKEGNIVKRYESKIDPVEIIPDIEKLL